MIQIDYIEKRKISWYVIDNRVMMYIKTLQFLHSSKIFLQILNVSD